MSSSLLYCSPPSAMQHSDDEANTDDSIPQRHREPFQSSWPQLGFEFPFPLMLTPTTEGPAKRSRSSSSLESLLLPKTPDEGLRLDGDIFPPDLFGLESSNGLPSLDAATRLSLSSLKGLADENTPAQVQDMYQRLSTRNFFEAARPESVPEPAKSSSNRAHDLEGSSDMRASGTAAAREFDRDDHVRPAQKRRRGRPRLNTQHDQTDRRRAQIRDAQRTYRQKKDQTISYLQSRNHVLELTIDRMQFLFLDVYKKGMEVALEQQNKLFLHTLASTAGKVLDLTRMSISGDDALESDDDSPRSVGPDAITDILGRRGSSVATMREALAVPVAREAGNTLAEKITEALYRMSFILARNAIETDDDEALHRIFPDGVDKASMLEFCRRMMHTTERFETQFWRGKDEDDRNYPGFVSPSGVGARIAQIMAVNPPGQERTTIDGDTLVAWLFGRGSCRGKIPRFREIDVNLGLLLAKKEL